MAEPNDVNVDELKRRARRRLVGAVVLALAAAVFVPMLLESDPKPLGEDVSVRIPPVDDGKFVNRLSDKGKIEPPKPSAKGDPAKADAARTEPPKVEAPRSDAAPAAPAKESAARDTLPKELSAKEAASRESAKDAASADSAAAPSAPGKNNTLNEAERKVLSASAKSAPANATATKATPAATAAPAPTAVAAVPASAPAGAKPGGAPGFSVQLAAFADDKGANALSNKLKKVGYPAYTEPLTTSKGTLWRVRVGPFASRDAAASSRDKLKGEGYSGIVAPAN
jgi:DedD protein